MPIPQPKIFNFSSKHAFPLPISLLPYMHKSFPSISFQQHKAPVILHHFYLTATLSLAIIHPRVFIENMVNLSPATSQFSF